MLHLSGQFLRTINLSPIFIIYPQFTTRPRLSPYPARNINITHDHLSVFTQHNIPTTISPSNTTIHSSIFHSRDPILVEASSITMTMSARFSSKLLPLLLLLSSLSLGTVSALTDLVPNHSSFLGLSEQQAIKDPPLRSFTAAELAQYDGETSAYDAHGNHLEYVGVAGRVYDITGGKGEELDARFRQAGIGGKDLTYAYANCGCGPEKAGCGLLVPDEIGLLEWEPEHLTKTQQKNLEAWVHFYDVGFEFRGKVHKYPLVGTFEPYAGCSDFAPYFGKGDLACLPSRWDLFPKCTLPSFTAAELAQYDGSISDGKYVGMAGRVYDVTGSEEPFEGGKDLTYAYANWDRDAKPVDWARYVGKLDWHLTDLDQSQEKMLRYWVQYFDHTSRMLGGFWGFPVVGTLKEYAGWDFSPYFGKGDFPSLPSLGERHSSLAQFDGTLPSFTGAELAHGTLPSFTAAELAQYDGSISAPRANGKYVGMAGRVYDVTGSEEPFDGGKDLTYAYANWDRDAKTVDWDRYLGKLNWDLTDLDPSQEKMLRYWVQYFEGFPVVGTLKEYAGWDFSPFFGKGDFPSLPSLGEQHISLAQFDGTLPSFTGAELAHGSLPSFTAAELAQYDGTKISDPTKVGADKNKLKYIGLAGRVYDVTGSGWIWGGKDATYALVSNSPRDADVGKLNWRLQDLDSAQEKDLKHWVQYFDVGFEFRGKVHGKYPVVGTLEEYVDWDFSPYFGKGDLASLPSLGERHISEQQDHPLRSFTVGLSEQQDHPLRSFTAAELAQYDGYVGVAGRVYDTTGGKGEEGSNLRLRGAGIGGKDLTYAYANCGCGPEKAGCGLLDVDEGKLDWHLQDLDAAQQKDLKDWVQYFDVGSVFRRGGGFPVVGTLKEYAGWDFSPYFGKGDLPSLPELGERLGERHSSLAQFDGTRPAGVSAPLFYRRLPSFTGAELAHGTLRSFTAAELAQFDGTKVDSGEKLHGPEGNVVAPLKLMYIGVAGKIYDVSKSDGFRKRDPKTGLYEINPKTGSPYGYGVLWGGKDVTYALATMSLHREDLGKLRWSLEDLSLPQKKSLRDWIQGVPDSKYWWFRKGFESKYKVVGTLKEYAGWDFSPYFAKGGSENQE